MHRFVLLVRDFIRVFRLASLAALVAGAALAGPAAARSGAADTCMNSDNVDAKIAACTDLLQGRAKLSKFDRAKYHGYRGWAYSQKRDYPRALADLDTSLTLNPNQFGAYGTRAGILKNIGEFDRALTDIDACIRLMPRFAPARSVRGDILRAKSDLDGALREYDKALKIDPTDLGAFIGRSLAFRIGGRLDEAEAELMRAMALDDRVAELYVAKGLLAESRQNIPDAREAYAHALTLPKAIVFANKHGSPIIDATRQREIARARLAVLDEAAKAVSSTTDKPSADAARNKVTKLALVIGNGAYRSASPLANPPHDAKLIAGQLRGIGFEAIEGIDLDRDSMRKQLAAFLAKAPTAQIALVFFAGHGLQIDGHNYLVPVDARLDGDRKLADELIDLDFVLAGLDDKTRTNVVVLDACRDDPFREKRVKVDASGRSVEVRAGLAPQSELGGAATSGTGMLLAFATAPGQVALDGEGGNSPFSTALARHIATPGLEVQQMLTRVRSEVVAATGGKQVPWSNSSLLGEVYLTR